MIGIDLIVGLEYKIPPIPIAVGLDYKPAINLVEEFDFWADGLAASIRFVF